MLSWEEFRLLGHQIKQIASLPQPGLGFAGGRASRPWSADERAAQLAALPPPPPPPPPLGLGLAGLSGGAGAGAGLRAREAAAVAPYTKGTPRGAAAARIEATARGKSTRRDTALVRQAHTDAGLTRTLILEP